MPWGRVSKFLLGGSLAAYGAYQIGDHDSWRIVRFGRAATTAVAIAFDYKWNLMSVDTNTDEYERILSEVHLRSANRLKDVCCKNGGCFIKVGQHIGGLDYLLPAEYVSTMKILHNQAPQSDVKELFETIETDLKCKVTDIFKEIDDKPIGTASLAQVHRAVLHDGTVVAVKIQHPKVKNNSETDIQTISFLTHAMAFIFPKFEMVWLAEETKKNLPIELDFINEGKNAEKVAKILKKFPYVKVPKIYWDFSSDRVLTMEFCEGGRIDDKDAMKKNEIDVSLISKRLGEIFSEMIFINGFVHADPHPGNLLINPVKSSKTGNSKDFELVIIDHGLYQSLSKKFRYNYAKIWMSILDRDIKKLEEYTKWFMNHEDVYFGLLACVVTGRSWDAITHGIDKVKYTPSEGLEIKSEAAKYLREISILLNKVPREMLLLLKTNDLIRGTETCLNTRNSASAFIALSKCCARLIHSYEREQHAEELRNNSRDLSKLKLTYLNARYNLISFIFEQFDLLKIFVYKYYLILFNNN